MIEMMNVTKKYNKGITAINNLSIQIKDGEFVYGCVLKMDSRRY